MDVKSIGANYAKPLPVEKPDKTGKVPEDGSQVEELKDDIKQTKAEIKVTMKELQEAAGESVEGASQKTQLLQNAIAMQQQEIALKQMQINKIEEPKKQEAAQGISAKEQQSRFDRYIASTEEEANEPDNIYRMGSEEDAKKIIFNRPLTPDN